MRTIRVQAYPVRPTFDSFDAAIKHARAYPPLADAKAAEFLVAGSQISDAYWTDTEFVIQFSNDRYLHIFLEAENDRGVVKWRMLESEPKLCKEEVGRIGADPVILTFENGKTFPMDRSKMMRMRIGKNFRKFFVNELGFYVYTPGQILCFDCVRSIDTGENLLFVYEEN